MSRHINLREHPQEFEDTLRSFRRAEPVIQAFAYAAQALFQSVSVVHHLAYHAPYNDSQLCMITYVPGAPKNVMSNYERALPAVRQQVAARSSAIVKLPACPPSFAANRPIRVPP